MALHSDERSMILMVDLANTIHPNIVMTGDCPSKQATGRVPMLDLAIYMEDVEKEVNTAIGPFRIMVKQVSYGSYRKPMPSKLIIRSTTSIPKFPMNMKHENAANELIRRVLNTKRCMNGYEEEKLLVTNAFMVTLQLSGYNKGFRHQTALAAFRGVKRMEETEAGGGRRVYCLQTEGSEARHRAKISPCGSRGRRWRRRLSGRMAEKEEMEERKIPSSQVSTPRPRRWRKGSPRMTGKLRGSFLSRSQQEAS